MDILNVCSLDFPLNKATGQYITIFSDSGTIFRHCVYVYPWLLGEETQNLAFKHFWLLNSKIFKNITVKAMKPKYFIA